MEKIYLNEHICNTIKEARERKGMSSRTLAYVMDRNPSWMSRVENNKVAYISKEEAEKFEIALDIAICTTTENELLQKINELMEENRRLKELLMEKWKKDSRSKYTHIEEIEQTEIKVDAQCCSCGIPMGSQDNFCPNCGREIIKG